MCARPSVREAVLDAAEAVAAEKGATHLTLEEVACRAGLTKAGVIYHFRSKEKLLHAMLERLVEDCEERMKDRADSEQESDQLKAMIEKVATETKERRRLCGSLLAGAATNPKLLAPVRSQYQKANKQRELESADFALSTIIFLAADGLWLQETLELSPLSDSQRDAVLERLKSLAEKLSSVSKANKKLSIKKNSLFNKHSAKILSKKITGKRKIS